MKRKRDWAHKAAERALFPHIAENERPFAKVARALRRAEKRGREQGYSDGYDAGASDQMKMRVADALDRLKIDARRRQP